MGEFKGTKGIWKQYQNVSGDIEISGVDFKKLAIINSYPDGFREKYINGKITGSTAPDSSKYRTEAIYNAKLISCAPEMLEALKYSLRMLKNSDSMYDKEYLEKLIKSATE